MPTPIRTLDDALEAFSNFDMDELDDAASDLQIAEVAETLEDFRLQLHYASVKLHTLAGRLEQFRANVKV